MGFRVEKDGSSRAGVPKEMLSKDEECLLRAGSRLLCGWKTWEFLLARMWLLE